MNRHKYCTHIINSTGLVQQYTTHQFLRKNKEKEENGKLISRVIHLRMHTRPPSTNVRLVMTLIIGSYLNSGSRLCKTRPSSRI